MKKWITKAEENRIIDAYSIRKGDIKAHEELEHTYIYQPAARAGKAAQIRLEQELHPIDGTTGRILVRHSDNSGKTVAVDAWAKDRDGVYQWICRNPAGMPLSDQAIIEDYERKMDAMRAEYHKIKDTKITKPAGRRPHPEKLDEQSKRVHELIDQGKKEQEITKELGISRATFFRAKKRISQ